MQLCAFPSECPDLPGSCRGSTAQPSMQNLGQSREGMTLKPCPGYRDDSEGQEGILGIAADGVVLLLQEYGVPFMETSAKTGMNVELAFLAIAK